MAPDNQVENCSRDILTICFLAKNSSQCILATYSCMILLAKFSYIFVSRECLHINVSTRDDQVGTQRVPCKMSTQCTLRFMITQHVPRKMSTQRVSRDMSKQRVPRKRSTQYTFAQNVHAKYSSQDVSATCSPQMSTHYVARNMFYATRFLCEVFPATCLRNMFPAKSLPDVFPARCSIFLKILILTIPSMQTDSWKAPQHPMKPTIVSSPPAPIRTYVVI